MPQCLSSHLTTEGNENRVCPFPVRVKFVPSALNDAVQHVLAMLYGDFDSHPSAKVRNEEIRQRYANGEGLSDLARAYRLSPQRVYQIVRNQ
jgi:hypothetical protein